jgi:hypothetical protein
MPFVVHHDLLTSNYTKGDKEFLSERTIDSMPAKRLKSTVALRLLSMYDGLTWDRFSKRKELVSWKLYNIRDQVQKIILHDKADGRIPLLRIAQDLRADDARLRLTRQLNAYADEVVPVIADPSDSTSDSAEESVPSNNNEESQADDMFTYPIE